MVTSVLVIILILILSYLVGSIPPSYLVGRIFYGVDIREQGSGNVGGANAARLFGKKFGAVAGLFDIFKGYLMVKVMQNLAINVDTTSNILGNQAILIASAGYLAIVGHCYSIFLRFKGGKGGATTAGVVMAIDPFTALILILFWFTIVATTRFTSLGNLLGVMVIPVMFSFRTPDNAYMVLSTLIIILIFFTHRANISLLLTGEERKFGQKETISQ